MAKVNSWRKRMVNLLKRLEEMDFTDRDFLAQHFVFVVLITALGLVYIANNHYAEKAMREISLMQKELKEMRWEYMTTKSELMHQSKQTEVANLVKHVGLSELKNAPKRIVVEKE